MNEKLIFKEELSEKGIEKLSALKLKTSTQTRDEAYF